MTIAELIIELQKLPQDAKVVHPDNSWFELSIKFVDMDAEYICDAFQSDGNVFFYM